MTARSCLALGAALLLVAASPTAAQQALPAIRVVTTPLDAGAQPFYAQTMGFFKKAGINVEITTMSNGSAIASAVASGAADIGQGNIASLAIAHDRGIPIVLIAGSNLFVAKVHQNAIVVAANSTLKTARDLNAKTVAVSGLQSIVQIGAAAWLEQNGANTQSVKFIDMPFANMADAILHNRVDAAVLAEPELDDELSKKDVRVLAYPYESIAKEFLLAGWFTNVAWLKAHPDAARAYRDAMRMAADWANTHKAESAKILERATGISVRPGSARVIYAPQLDPQAMQPLIDAAAKYGALRATFPASELVGLP